MSKAGQSKSWLAWLADRDRPGRRLNLRGRQADSGGEGTAARFVPRRRRVRLRDVPRLVRRRASDHPVAAARAGTVRMVRQLQSRWRSSLQLRVVSTTLVVSALVVSLLGFFLMQQIASNLLNRAEAQALTQGRDGLLFAQSDPAASRPPGAGSQDAMAKILERLLPTAQSSGADYGVAITVRQNMSQPAYWAAVQSKLDYRSLPQPAALAASGPIRNSPLK